MGYVFKMISRIPEGIRKPLLYEPFEPVWPGYIRKNESLIQPMNIGYGKDPDDVIMADFMPSVIGEYFKFPTRTVLSEKAGLDWIGTEVVPMAETNLPFVFETMDLPPYNKSHVDLKWAAEVESQNRICSYFENLMMLMRNKVLMNGGDLSATKIAWFYPASMSSKRVTKIRDTWKMLYGIYFGGDSDTQIITMSESVVPYYYRGGNFGHSDSERWQSSLFVVLPFCS